MRFHAWQRCGNLLRMNGASVGKGRETAKLHSATKRAALVPRVLAKTHRLFTGEHALLGVRLISGLLKHGPRYAHHLHKEQTAWRKGRRADAQVHLLARLNLAGSQRGTRVKALLDGLEQRDVASFDFGSLAPLGERAAELFGQLNLAEVADLLTYFRFFGDFRIANWLRIQLLERHLRAQHSATHLRVTALAAALELGRPNEILELVDLKQAYPQDRSAIDDATAMAHALRGDAEQAERLWAGYLSNDDRAFGAALRGRTVAIVGPAHPDVDLAQEIDSFDLVVRMNYFSAVDPRAGTRTDISYYNGSRVKNQTTEIRNVASGLRWLVSIRATAAKMREIVPEHPGIRKAHSGRKLFFEGHPLAVPCILSDLLRFQPQRIKLFGTDFYSRKSAYDTLYQGQLDTDAISFAIRKHEPISSFKFVKHLKNAGLVEADAVAAEVLNMSNEQYAARLQELYGPYTAKK
jgi:hypothetical protein